MIKSNAFYGESTGPMLFNNVVCHGWETSITECTYRVYPNFQCSPQLAYGLICKDSKCFIGWSIMMIIISLACNNGDVRLTSGYFDNEGAVEVCGNRQWSYVADANFTAANARVICRQLGYPSGVSE